MPTFVVIQFVTFLSIGFLQQTIAIVVGAGILCSFEVSIYVLPLARSAYTVPHAYVR